METAPPNSAVLSPESCVLSQDSKPGTQDSKIKTQNPGLQTPKLLFFLLLLAAASFSAPSCVSNATDLILSNQGIGIAAAFMLTIVVIAVAYAAGTITANSGLTILAKDELYHLFFSVLLLIGFSGIVVFSCQTISFFYDSSFSQMGTLKCYQPGYSMDKTSTCYIGLAQSDAERIAQFYIAHHISNMMDSTFAFSVQIPLLDSFTVTADAYKKVHAQQYDMVLNTFVLPALISINMQKIMLEFVNNNVIAWVLPIAFLFRVIVPFRQMGNVLIALAVGLYILIPFMYTLNLAMYDVMGQSCSGFSAGVTDFVFGPGCDPYGFWNVGRLMPQAFFLPNLTMALFITFLTAVNKALRAIG